MDDGEVSYEPMDVDLSSNSISAMEISYVDRDFEHSPIIIKKEKDDDGIVNNEKYLNIKPLTSNNLIEKHTLMLKRNRAYSKLIFKLVICVIVAIFSAVTYQIVYFRCNESINTDLLKNTFVNKVYGQSAATSSLLKALEGETMNKIIVLYGGTGVGKTYTVSLLLDNILNYGNTYHYTMPGFTQSSLDLMLGLIYCKSSVIVVDDLNKNDILIVEDHIKNLVSKSIKYSKILTIILIYNCHTMGDQLHQRCDDMFLHDLKHSLATIEAHKFYIKFESLTKEHLRKCIESELTKKTLSESDIVEIMKNFNVTLDGCKGVYQKMKYLSII
ncbi:uncharacterized protein LOC124530762 [Vanessa cardui]|uniref:uncharacterized protein LOC124530762 n=1 Tax=Vanessa cardui TaxID=171605 RepID=UPI001F12D6DB|nr:uncharacterized protein LOC124530762 [Vanessa cardui]